MTQWTRSFAIVLAAACLAAPACGQAPASAQTSDAGDVAARLGDRTVTVGDLDKKWLEIDEASYMRSIQERFDIRNRVLDLMIGDYLIEQQAKARGMTSDQLLAEETTKRVHEVTDAELEMAYSQMRGQLNGASLDQVRPAIRSYLDRQQKAQARDALVEELRDKATGIDVRLDPPRYTITTPPDEPVRGPANAPIEIVEFSDFQCPFCGRAVPTIDKLLATYGDRIKLVYRDFPLTSLHPHAYDAAEAGECARQQGKFWEYHDRLFANQRALASADLVRHAADLDLDVPAFSACLKDGRAKPRVEADV
jgi:protein-disulfide isomerase